MAEEERERERNERAKRRREKEKGEAMQILADFYYATPRTISAVGTALRWRMSEDSEI